MHDGKVRTTVRSPGITSARHELCRSRYRCKSKNSKQSAANERTGCCMPAARPRRRNARAKTCEDCARDPSVRQAAGAQSVPHSDCSQHVLEDAQARMGCSLCHAWQSVAAFTPLKNRTCHRRKRRAGAAAQRSHVSWRCSRKVRRDRHDERSEWSRPLGRSAACPAGVSALIPILGY